jgi:hypothetical protein
LARPTEAPRLLWRREYRKPDGSLREAAQWFIADRGKRWGTGCGFTDRAAAEQKLAAYLSRRRPAAKQTEIRRSYSEDAPLRLDIAAAIAFPDGTMSAEGLRQEHCAGRLTIEAIGGSEYTTLAAIERMRGLCRVPIATSLGRQTE